MRPHRPLRLRILALLTAGLAFACSGRAMAAEPTGAATPQAPLPAPAPSTPAPPAAEAPAAEAGAVPSDAAAPRSPSEERPSGSPQPTPTEPGQPTPPPEQPAVPPPVVPVPPAPPAKPPRPDEVFGGRPVPETEEERQREHSWFDAGHSFVGRVFFKPVVRLDRFFSDETALDPERGESFARVRGGLRLRQDGKPTWSGDVLAQLALPGVESWLHRFRLVLTGMSDSTENDPTADATTTAPLARRRTEPANLELRFGAFHGIRSSVDVGAGILFRLPPGAFTRARYRLAIPIDDVLVSRSSYEVFWRTDMLLGTRLTSALEWPVTPSSMVRLGGSGQVAQRKTDGLEYGVQLIFSHAFTSTFATALGTDATGDTHSPVAFEKYRVFTRLRHDVLRRWLFVEAEPEVGWPWTPARGRYRALAVTFRLEMQFQGAGAVNEP